MVISKRIYRIDFPNGKTIWANTLEEVKRKRRNSPTSWGKPKIKRINLSTLLKRKR